MSDNIEIFSFRTLPYNTPSLIMLYHHVDPKGSVVWRLLCIYKSKTFYENSVNYCVFEKIAHGNMQILTVADFKMHVGFNREMMCSTQRVKCLFHCVSA